MIDDADRLLTSEEEFDRWSHSWDGEEDEFELIWGVFEDMKDE